MLFKISKKRRKQVANAWDKTKRGFGSSVRFTQKYAPIAERRLGRAASTVVDSFAVKPSEKLEIDYGLPMRPVPSQPPMFRQSRPMRRRNTSDWGKLNFNI